MAAVSAPRHSQDVSFQNFQSEEGAVEAEDDIEEIVVGGDIKPTEDVKEETNENEETDTSAANESNKESNKRGGGGKFTLGMEDGAEFIDELSFSIQHCGLSSSSKDGGQAQEAGAGVVVEGQPPPGHWVSQPHGEFINN